MAAHIPFVNTRQDLSLTRRFYSDSEIIRMPLEFAERAGELPEGARLWVDGSVDAFEQYDDASLWAWAGNFSENAHILEAVEGGTLDRERVQKFVDSILNRCAKQKPAWISVPQLRYENDASRNAINRALSKATLTWKSKRKFKGRLILPVVLKHQEQVNSKTQRNRKIDLAASCFGYAGADGYWIVESSLADWKGERKYEGTRFPGIIGFHEELQEKIGESNVISVGGPYWALNLVLWARQLVQHPAIGLGTGYQYHLRFGRQLAARTRVALTSLRRTVRASPELEVWLDELPEDDDAFAPLRELGRRLPRLMQNPNDARVQIASFYKEWFDKIAAAKPSGRALALYQDFSSAYVLGNAIKKALPPSEAPARRPERVAKQMMMQCLSP